MGVYIPGVKIPDGEYVRVLMLFKDGTCIDGIGNVFKIIYVPPHGRLIDVDKLDSSETDYLGNHLVYLVDIDDAPTIIPAEEGET